MPRDIPIGNGKLLAAFDFDYRIRDFYYPRVGKENHALGYPWRLGLWCEGRFSWVGRERWRIERGYVADALVTDVTLTHPGFPLRLRFNDVIDYEKNLLLRRVRVQNLSDRDLALRLFFHADLNALENEIGDTVFFDPKNASLVHYKGPRYFLMSCSTPAALGVKHFATGKKRSLGLEGTWRDAEDGELAGNTIAQGAVDSVIGLELTPGPGATVAGYYWMAVGTSYSEVEALHRYVTSESDPDEILARNADYWRHWNAGREEELELLPPELRVCYRRSLLILRTQVDSGGAIIAANDTDIRQFNLDTYSYMWPRDGALAAYALDRAGHAELARRFLEFCTQRALQYNYSASILSERGFLMHKYNPDGSVGSSWHPWIADGEFVFPIQEDETALVVWVVWQHYLLHHDIEALHGFYHPFVEQAADFLLSFRDEATGLPLPSYDLWEEDRGVFTFTAAAVAAALGAAARLALLYHDQGRAGAYERGAREMLEAINRHLYLPREQRFARGLISAGGAQRTDSRLDASLLALALTGVYAPGDPRVRRTAQAVERHLWVEGAIGGLARYQGDDYHRDPSVPAVPGNPWLVTTLWLARYRIAAAARERELDAALALLAWAKERALPSGVMPEQVHPVSGDFLSVSPLTWSHAAFVSAALDYLEKLQALRGRRAPEATAARSEARASLAGG